MRRGAIPEDGALLRRWQISHARGEFLACYEIVGYVKIIVDLKKERRALLGHGKTSRCRVGRDREVDENLSTDSFFFFFFCDRRSSCATFIFALINFSIPHRLGSASREMRVPGTLFADRWELRGRSEFAEGRHLLRVTSARKPFFQVDKCESYLMTRRQRLSRFLISRRELLVVSL